MPNYDYCCDTCDSITVEQYKIAEKPETITCACGGTAKFQIGAPMVMGTALPDGTKRKGWAQLREASKLNKSMAAAKPENRREMAKEIKKLGVTFNK
jgi:hypothetical protein